MVDSKENYKFELEERINNQTLGLKISAHPLARKYVNQMSWQKNKQTNKQKQLILLQLQMINEILTITLLKIDLMEVKAMT